jgi:hypothetical protein
MRYMWRQGWKTESPLPAEECTALAGWIRSSPVPPLQPPARGQSAKVPLRGSGATLWTLNLNAIPRIKTSTGRNRDLQQLSN